MAHGSDADPHPSSSNDVIENQFRCLADYLHQKDPRKVDVYVQASLTGEFTVFVFVVAASVVFCYHLRHAKSIV